MAIASIRKSVNNEDKVVEEEEEDVGCEKNLKLK